MSRIVAFATRKSCRIGLALLLLGLAGAVFAEVGVERFAVCYSKSAPLDDLARYDLLVLDSDDHPPLAPLAHKGKTLLGYLSLGEVADNRSWFDLAKSEGILLDENPSWPGSYMVDLRRRWWTEQVIEYLIPRILAQQFDGLFLDTLDNAAHLERLDPHRFAGMTGAAERLVRTIRLHYPDAVLMLNRAYELLPQIDGQIDMVLGESMLGDYDFATRSYGSVDEALYEDQVQRLREARVRRPGLGIFTLDYWDPADSAGVESIYRRQRANGFVPYVATVELDRIVPEPGR